MTDETTEPQGSENPETPEHKRSLKEDFREGLAKAAGYTVEVASVLAQQGGDAVQAEKEAAEADTGEFIDRIDGEG
jgi:hypothetical protein